MKKVMLAAATVCGLYSSAFGSAIPDSAEDENVRRLHEIVSKGVENLETWELNSGISALAYIPLWTAVRDQDCVAVTREVHRRLEKIILLIDTGQDVKDSELDGAYSILQTISGNNPDGRICDRQEYEKWCGRVWGKECNRIMDFLQRPPEEIDFWTLEKMYNCAGTVFPTDMHRNHFRGEIKERMLQYIDNLLSQPAPEFHALYDIIKNVGSIFDKSEALSVQEKLKEKIRQCIRNIVDESTSSLIGKLDEALTRSNVVFADESVEKREIQKKIRTKITQIIERDISDAEKDPKNDKQLCRALFTLRDVNDEEIKSKFSEAQSRLQTRFDARISDMESKLQNIQSQGIANVGPECLAGLCDKLPYEMAQELYRKGYGEILELVPAQVQQRIVDERLRLSRRDLSAEEQKAVHALLAQLDLPKNTVVGIMDAISYINGLPGLSDEEKSRYLSLRSEPRTLLDVFADECLFETSLLKDSIIREVRPQTSLLKDSIIREVRPYIFKSQTYRDAIACHLARTRAKPLVSDALFRNKTQGGFAQGKVSACCPDTGKIKLSPDRLGIHSLFGGSLRQLWQFPTGQCVATGDMGYFLYHEGGHFRVMDKLELFPTIDDSVFKLYLAFTKISVDEQMFRKWVDSVYDTGEDYAVLSMHSTFRPGKQIVVDWKNKATLDGSPLEGIVENAAWIPADMEQIMGTLVLENAGTTYLFINQMNDCNLFSQLGLPIRMDHNGLTTNMLKPLHERAPLPFLPWTKELWTPTGAVNALNTKYFLSVQKSPKEWIVPKHAETFVKFAPNLNAFGPLWRLFGTSMSEYWRKMMYPYGLWSTLSFEYRFPAKVASDSLVKYENFVLRGKLQLH